MQMSLMSMYRDPVWHFPQPSGSICLHVHIRALFGHRYYIHCLAGKPVSSFDLSDPQQWRTRRHLTCDRSPHRNHRLPRTRHCRPRSGFSLKSVPELDRGRNRHKGFSANKWPLDDPLKISVQASLRQQPIKTRLRSCNLQVSDVECDLCFPFC